MFFSTGWILFSSLWVVSFTWTIHIRTADRADAGTDSNVTIKLFGDDDEISSDIQLIRRFENDFKRGGHDEFSIAEEDIQGFTRSTTLNSIELWTTSGVGASSPDWKVDSVVIDNPLGDTSFPFPLFRWVQPGRHYNVSLYDTSLPQHEHFVEQRLAELSEAKLNYEYHQNIRNLSLVGLKDVPADDFSSEVAARTSMQHMEAGANVRLAMYMYGQEWDSFESIKDIFSYKFSHFDELYTSSSFFRSGNDSTCERGNKLPEGIDDWDDDVHFGLQRLTGVNTQTITLFSRKDYRKRFPITNKLLNASLQGMTIREAQKMNRLFVCDYKILDGVKPKDNFTQSAPIGLFFLDNDGNLKPIAIQLFQVPGPDNPIFTPEDPPNTWNFVKMWFNTADAAYHQVTHLGGVHLIMDGILVASHRNLARSHPIFKLLAPHFLVTFQLNSAIPSTLTNTGAVFARLYGIGAAGMLEGISRYISSWRMDLDGNLPEFLKQRGLDDPKVLPGFYYREDALLLHHVIQDYTREYVALYYTSPEILQGDQELQNWAGDLVRPTDAPSPGCGLQGVPGNGDLTTADQLVQILTYIIYTCSVGHASVDNKQKSQIPYPPNYPTALSGAPPTSKTAIVTDKDILHSLANRQQALGLMKFLDLLGDRRTNPLGDFEIDYVVDPPAVKVVDRFKGHIREASATIKLKNKSRSPPYESLDPDNIRNSISN